MVFDEVFSPHALGLGLGLGSAAAPAFEPPEPASLARWSRAVAVPVWAQGLGVGSDAADKRPMQTPQRLFAHSRSPGADASVLPADTPVMQAVSLAALRGLHANHRQAKVDAFQASTTADNALVQKAPPAVALGEVAAFTPQSAAPAQAATPSDGAAASANSVAQLQSLVESCCQRLWVSEGAGGIPQGVMLDLGRSMPGCTIELAKAAGVLRITLRGVDERLRGLLDQELNSLGAALAHKLGCQVVAQVETQQELP